MYTILTLTPSNIVFIHSNHMFMGLGTCLVLCVFGTTNAAFAVWIEAGNKKKKKFIIYNVLICLCLAKMCASQNFWSHANILFAMVVWIRTNAHWRGITIYPSLLRLWNSLNVWCISWKKFIRSSWQVYTHINCVDLFSIIILLLSIFCYSNINPWGRVLRSHYLHRNVVGKI